MTQPERYLKAIPLEKYIPPLITEIRIATASDTVVEIERAELPEE